MTTPKEGWTWLSNSTKWHYFVEGRSLCTKWMYFGRDSDLDPAYVNSPDNCKACRAKLEKRQKAAGEVTA